MEEGRAHEERDVALAPASHGRRLARPVFLAAVALALLSFAAIVSGGEISSGLQQMRDVIGARKRVPIARRRLRGAEAPLGWFESVKARRAREDRQFAALRAISDVAHEATRVGSRVKEPDKLTRMRHEIFFAQAGAEPIANHDRRTLIKGDHIIGVKQRFPVAWAAPKRSWLTEPAPTASS